MLKKNHSTIILSMMYIFGMIFNCSQAFAYGFSGYYLTLSSSGSQNIDVSSIGDKTAISADNINVTTDCRNGYNLTLSTSVDNNNLYLDGNSSNNATGTFFSPANGSTILKDSPNTWGYYYNDSSSVIPTSSNIFNPVPALGNAATLKTPLDSPSSTDIDDNFNVYYGVATSDSMSVGNYKMIPDVNNENSDGALVYQATLAESCIVYTGHYEPSSIFEGETITGTGIVADQSLYYGIDTPLTSNTFTAPSGYYFAGWNTEQDGTGESYLPGEEVADLTYPGDTYILYAQWTDCPPNNICYSNNTTDEVAGSMGNEPIAYSDTSIDLYAANFSRPGYGFAGWNTKANGKGISYGPNETIRFATRTYNTGGLKLYAIWIASKGNMQNWNKCSDMSIGDITALKDTRDNNVYTIAKLADGKCWMTENLRLANKDSNNNDINLSSDNTHNPSLPITNTWWYSSANDNDVKPTSNHLSVATDPTTTTWCSRGLSNCIDQSMLATNNTTQFTNNIASNYSVSSNVYSYGNYYNWYSATAGQGKFGSDYNSNYTALGDICPTGWHLPTGKDTTGDFSVLDIALGGTGTYQGTIEASNRWRTYPNNFVYSGGENSNRGSSGYYWSSSAYTSSSVYYMYLNISGNINPGIAGALKYGGQTVRCIAGT